MKELVIDKDVPFLPEEIIRNILKRLPAKSLIRFQCVSKHWKNLIKNTSFIADHLHHSTHQNPCLLSWSNDTGPLKLHVLDCEMQVRRVPNHPLIDYLNRGHVVGSSNGLLCVDISEDDVSYPSLLLCNPAIRQVRQVPTTCTDFKGSLGFGFSPIINDYKIVKIYVDVRFNDLVKKVELYSLRTGSWKQVELGILDGAHSTSESCGFTADGAIFWFGFKLEGEDENGYGVIVSFDIAMEVFTSIPMPTLPARSQLKRLTIYENKLAMLSCRGIENCKSSLVDLWVREDGTVASGGRCNWTKKCTKKYTSNPYPHFLVPMTIWKNGIVCSIIRRIGMGIDYPDTVFFSLTTEDFTEFAVSRSRVCHHIFNYVEALYQLEE